MKMKNRQLNLLGLLLAALLCACGQQTSAVPREPEGTPTVRVIEDLRPTEACTRAESLAMANYLCANRALLSGEYLYTLDYDTNLQPVLGRYRVVDNTLREFTVLAENCVAEYLTEDGGELYFLCDGQIEKLSPATGKRQTLCSGAKSLQKSGELLYYLDGEDRFCSMATDGSGKTVLLAERCAYPYVMGELLLVQKGADEALYLCRLGGEGEWRLTEGAAYAPLCVERELYYTGQSTEGKRLCRVELTGDGTAVEVCQPLIRGTAEFFYADGAWQTRLAHEGDLLRQEIRPLSGGEAQNCEYSGYHLLDYVGAGLRVDAVYEAGGRLNSFMLYTPDGGVIRYFGGQVMEG